MKAIDIFCASQAATTTMESNTPSSSSSGSGGRAIDRHNPIIQDQKRITKIPPTPPSPNKKTTKTSKNNINDPKRNSTSFADENENKHDHQQILVKNNNKNDVKKQGGGVLLGWGCTKPSGFISPATSSRFLLSDKSLSDQFDPLIKKHVLPAPQQQPLVEKTRKSFSDRFFKINKNDQVTQSALPVINVNDANKRKDEVLMQSVLPVINVVNKKIDEGRHLPASSPALTTPRSSSSLSSTSSQQQEVVLRVSLHCKGCVKKMRKHISKMEGVTSFNIDFLAKKVTVVGNITPLAVLTSVSKVKNAKLLTPTTISSPHVPPTPSYSNLSEVKKQLGL
ncbi:sodium potassium root defective 2-like protein [Tanacetum coccineum]